MDRLYGSRISGRKWDDLRRKKSFETVPEAKKRTLAEKNKIETGLKKPKDHVGPYSSYQINSSLLLNIASSWTDATKLNWTKIGQQCITDQNGNIPANCGQIAKQILIDKENNEGFQYSYMGKNESKGVNCRRSHKRLNSKVSFPMEPTCKRIKRNFGDMVESGVYDIGENVVETTIKKMKADKTTGLVYEHTFTIYGRKHSLCKLRIKLFNKYKQFMRLNSNSYFENLSREELIEKLNFIGEFMGESENSADMRERLKRYERTRNFQIWHDGSVITNHGHIVFCINVLYDPAVFYTSAEYKRLRNIDINIQREVEDPELYIIGRCGSNDEQLAYIPTRIEDLRGLKIGLNLNDIDNNYENIILCDTMRFFHGDGPAAALEAGNQKGGHYFCPSCDVHLCRTDDISHCYQQKTQSLEDKQDLVLRGKYGRANSLRKCTSPFENLSIDQLSDELKSRGIDIESKKLKMTKKDLIPQIKMVLKGIKRLPILLLNNPLSRLSLIELANYEITMVACMHDIAYYIDNVFVELPNHAKPNDKIELNSYLDVYNAEKEKKRCCDRRMILLRLTRNTYLKIDGKVHMLLRTLSEIQRILYLGDDFRTPKEILRLHNVCFEHFVLLKELICIDSLSAKMTRDKLYGKYKHNLLVHAPLQYRLVSGESINCEDEERIFNSIKSITRNTTNNHPGHVIDNLIARQEVEAGCKKKYDHDKKKILLMIYVSWA